MLDSLLIKKDNKNNKTIASLGKSNSKVNYFFTDPLSADQIDLDETPPEMRSQILNNGMINDPNHYLQYTAGGNDCLFGVWKGCKLYVSDFNTLAPHEWLSASAIDACCAALITECTDTSSYIFNMHETTMIFKNDLTKTKFIHLNEKNLENFSTLLLPYHVDVGGSGHWCLLSADTSSKTVRHFDSLSTPKLGKIAFQKFLKFLKVYHEFSLHDLGHPSEWKLKPVGMAYPKQKDGYNCGVFVIYYIKCIMNREAFPKDFDANEFRSILMVKLIKTTFSMVDICLYCGRKTRINGEKWVQCKNCRRWLHFFPCLKYMNMTFEELEANHFYCSFCSH